MEFQIRNKGDGIRLLKIKISHKGGFLNLTNNTDYKVIRNISYTLSIIYPISKIDTYW